MAGIDGATEGPNGLELMPVPAGGPSGRVVLGVALVVLVMVMSIALAGQSVDNGPRSDGLIGGPTGVPEEMPPPTLPPGTPPPRVSVQIGPAATCPPGSTPDQPGPVDQPRPPAGSMAFDRESRRIVLVADAGVGMATWTFDVCTNTWTRMHPNLEPPPGTGQLVYDADSDLTIAADGSRLWAYDLEADTWREKGFYPVGDASLALRLYDPVSGLVVATADDGIAETLGPGLWAYEVETDRWTPIHQANPMTFEAREYVYDASVDRLVAYAAGSRDARTWLFDLRTGTWSERGAVTPVFSYGWFLNQTAIAYDEAAERTMLAGQGNLAAYDASADRWETLYLTRPADQQGGCGPECRDGHQMVFDAVNERLVVYGGSVYSGCIWETPDDMWRFDTATGSWTLIVPPSSVSPPLRDLTAGEAAASTNPGRSPWIRAEKVTLHGGPFFTRVAGVPDEPWASSPPADPATAADGRFLPECQLWTEGTVWWEETTRDPSSRAWIEIDLGGTFELDAAVVQADVNDAYLLSYRDSETAMWAPLWFVPLGEAGGMATRPQQSDASVRWDLAQPVVTDALRFEAVGGDAQYSVSEIAVFGRAAAP